MSSKNKTLLDLNSSFDSGSVRPFVKNSYEGFDKTNESREIFLFTDRAFIAAFCTKDVEITAAVNVRYARSATLAYEGIDGFPDRIIDKRKGLMLTPRRHAVKYFHRGRRDEKDRTGSDPDPDAVFLEQVILFSFQFMGKQVYFFFPVPDEFIGKSLSLQV